MRQGKCLKLGHLIEKKTLDLRKGFSPGMVADACNCSTQEVEAGGFQVQASLDYTARPCLKNKTKHKQTNKPQTKKPL
jgi:hypothetical protein